MMKRTVVLVSAATAGLAAYALGRRSWETWGVAEGEATRPLPGDDVVPDGQTLLTRGITIDAPPEAVWPFLVQMGYGRAGWYSYDQLDMKGSSADEIVPELQQLAVGDVMPTHPAGGFEVKQLEPNRALVVYFDTTLAESQASLATAPISVADTPGLAASGRFLETATPPQFAVSWAFVLEPHGSSGTRLIERFRGKFGPGARMSALMLPLLGFGTFVMMRKQLLGIRDRVERTTATAISQRAEAGVPEPLAADGAQPAIDLDATTPVGAVSG